MSGFDAAFILATIFLVGFGLGLLAGQSLQNWLVDRITRSTTRSYKDLV